MATENIPEQLLRLVTPQHVRSYALARGWERVPDVNGEIALFQRPGAAFDQLIVPMNMSFDDYGRRIADVVSGLVEVEKRAPIEILNDLLMPDADVIRYRMISPETEKGTVPLQEGISLLEGARRSLLAAACSVITPVRHHPRMSRAEANQLLEACLLRQTERRSFTVSVACPLRAVEQDQLLIEGVEPFTRRATILLMRSVHRLVSAIEADQVPIVYEPHDDGLVLSANLCDALLRMQPAQERSTLELTASWASTLPQPAAAQVPEAVKIRSEYFPIIEDVYKKLRPAHDPTSSLFVGYVDALNGNPGDDGRMQGETTLLVVHDGEMIKARADLNADDYQTAVAAHGSAGLVKLRGVLHLGRRVHRITNVTEFERVPE